MHVQEAGTSIRGADTRVAREPAETVKDAATCHRPYPIRACPKRFVHLLVEDPDLARGLSSDDRRIVERAFRAPVVTIERALWNPPECDPATTFGLLVLDGLLGRRVLLGQAVATELLGAGDVLRPWDEPLGFHFIPPELNWRVFRTGRVAVIDERITSLIGARPELLVAFSSRLLRRVRSLAYLNAVSHLHTVEAKLHTLLWHLASTYGRVTPRGIRIPFRLTHEILGEIVGAQRPSITLAMSRLQEHGELGRDRTGWLLAGKPTAPAVSPSLPDYHHLAATDRGLTTPDHL
jgi:CRP/FNR family transcriptional regulator, cyclic AMP receptor protein